ncbi:uncharacterized protein IL334_007395 [Kwoniella shivajii]|uniref:Uncharacterized protein n=1 Tax=Kwoniella shivajii TaxID=564305 RepID=A0ABZ1D9Y3_9TREE|nr:hypothetical protein IL334_007395 [Kwoniella shivajii]
MPELRPRKTHTDRPSGSLRPVRGCRIQPTALSTYGESRLLSTRSTVPEDQRHWKKSQKHKGWVENPETEDEDEGESEGVGEGEGQGTSANKKKFKYTVYHDTDMRGTVKSNHFHSEGICMNAGFLCTEPGESSDETQYQTQPNGENASQRPMSSGCESHYIAGVHQVDRLETWKDGRTPEEIRSIEQFIRATCEWDKNLYKGIVDDDPDTNDNSGTIDDPVKTPDPEALDKAKKMTTTRTKKTDETDKTDRSVTFRNKHDLESIFPHCRMADCPNSKQGQESNEYFDPYSDKQKKVIRSIVTNFAQTGSMVCGEHEIDELQDLPITRMMSDIKPSRCNHRIKERLWELSEKEKSEFTYLKDGSRLCSTPTIIWEVQRKNRSKELTYLWAIDDITLSGDILPGSIRYPCSAIHCVDEANAA